jgi:hypothetical protein
MVICGDFLFDPTFCVICVSIETFLTQPEENQFLCHIEQSEFFVELEIY